LNTSRVSALLVLLCVATLSTVGVAQHHFSAKEYEQFHDVLHPLEHEALPNKDYRRIRSQSGELVKRGKAVVKGGVPEALIEEKKTEFMAELKTFDAALNKFKNVARRGSNTKLKTSYSAVHDSFEKLMSMLPSR
jgi:hypothetical protein